MCEVGLCLLYCILDQMYAPSESTYERRGTVATSVMKLGEIECRGLGTKDLAYRVTASHIVLCDALSDMSATLSPGSYWRSGAGERRPGAALHARPATLPGKG